MSQRGGEVSRRNGTRAGSIPAPAPTSEARFRSELVTVGTFDVHVSHPHFEDAGDITAPTFVFPKSSVWIEHEHEPAFVVDPNTVTFYNTEQPFIRRQLSPEGDHCHWFELQNGLAAEVVRQFEPAAAENGSGPFRFTHGPADRDAYLLQQQLLQHLLQESTPDRLYVEEAVVQLLTRVVGRAYARLGHVAPTPAARRAALAEEARAFLAVHFAEQLSLPEIARAVGSSVFHLCRIFRAQTGGTLHAYRNELRLRSALTRLADTPDLTELSLDLGYCSHSHFTWAFTRAFGCSPSEFRRKASPRVAERADLSKAT